VDSDGPIAVKTSTSIAKTATVSPTPVISIPLSSPAATATTNLGTVVAMQTQLAFQMTSTAAAIQAMPQTGFFDEVGLPGMIILALALVVVIFLARRMRRSPVK
jgi:hypothetical protein